MSTRTNMAMKRLFWAIGALLLVTATSANACTVKEAPQMCSALAADPDFWIGEYRGRLYDFAMELDGTPFRPPDLQTTGTLTLFNMNGQLGFSGGGAFSGSAEISGRHTGPLDPLDPAWNWIEADSALEHLVHYGEYNRADCGYPSWPRWVGTFETLDGLQMTLTLLGVAPDAMLGRVYYKGPFRDTEVMIDSRFLINRDSFDTARWPPIGYRDNDMVCTDVCVEGEYVQFGWIHETGSPERRPRYGVTENCPAG